MPAQPRRQRRQDFRVIRVLSKRALCAGSFPRFAILRIVIALLWYSAAVRFMRVLRVRLYSRIARSRARSPRFRSAWSDSARIRG